MSRIDHTISEESNLLSIIAQVHPTASKNSLRKMIDSGRILLDNEVCRIAKTSVSPGQLISVLPKSEGDAPPEGGEEFAEEINKMFEEDEHKLSQITSISRDIEESMKKFENLVLLVFCFIIL